MVLLDAWNSITWSDWLVLVLGFGVVTGLSVIALMGAQAVGYRLTARIEQCDECGFDGRTIDDEQALALVQELPDWWAAVVLGLDETDLQRRPVADRWSIAEYTDHVRETAFGMRFLMDTALTSTDVDLGNPPPTTFAAEPLPISTAVALDGFRSEVDRFVAALESIPQMRWSESVTVEDNKVDVRWILRHLIHDVTHHLGDIQQLKDKLEQP